MSAQVIDGKSLAQKIQQDLSRQVADLTPALGRAPTLAVVLVGDDPASQVYVRSKSRNAKSCGIDTRDLTLSGSIANQELQQQLTSLSADPTVDGILLQLPLPSGLDEFAALMCIAPALDVDGLHPVNQGLLVRGSRSHRPCTPLGTIELIKQGLSQLGKPADLKGLHAVVVGRSILVGKPVALLLLENHCTVTICHSRTVDLATECLRADILVAAIGKPRAIPGEYVKPGAVVIDVGINRLASGELVGDVDYTSAAQRAGAITPVPGGVGPMTIAMLLSNTVDAARLKLKQPAVSGTSPRNIKV